MSEKISLSIVIPAYNEENHIKKCLDSVARQTEKPDEVIVVDNNSADKTAEIAESYPFVRLISETRQGVVFARDKGFNSAGSDIIGRIDADTVLPEGWTYYVKKFYGDPDHADHCLTGGCYFYNVRLPRFAGWWQGQIAFRINRLLMGHYILFGSNMAIPRQSWQRVKSDVCHDTDVHEDLDLAIHANNAEYNITYRESLKVGVKMRRVFSDRKELWGNLMLWPKTLKKHGRWTWIFGWFGALIMYVMSPMGVVLEYIARLFGKNPLN